jgi:ribose transport system permease protein
MVLRMSASMSDDLAREVPGKATAAMDGARPAKRPGVMRQLVSRYATVLILIVLMALFTMLSPQFLTGLNLRNIVLVQVTACCMAFAALLPLIIGEFDLSLGFMLGFLMVFAALLGSLGLDASLVVPAMILGGAAIGAVSGLLRVIFNVSSFIATLAVGIGLSGATLGLSGGQVLFQGIPPFLTTVGQQDFLGLGISVWLTILLAILFGYVLEHTPFGRRLYAIGGSERVAFLAGIRVSLYRILAFAGAGFFVGIAAMLQLGQAGAANPIFGPELLLPAYAAAFLGVTTYRPGTFNVPGTLISIVLLAVGFNGLNLLGAPYWLQPIFNGVVLIAAVIMARAESHRA